MASGASDGGSDQGASKDASSAGAVSGPSDVFNPVGLKVLVVDDDVMCLKVVSAMLRRCSYEVTTCNSGSEALALLRARNEDGAAEGQFDLVLSDVYMPDMDGFKLLEHIGLELDLPVIMMSSNGDTNVVLRGVTHGAVDFLIKPVRIEELRNVWQHVVRRRSMALARHTEESHDDEDDSQRHGTKRKESEASPVLLSTEQAGTKKPRVVWSVEMHQQFVNAVNTLGIDKAVPKRILDLMNVEGLTRENVASHLQKYRLYLKRVEGVQSGNGSGKGGRGSRNGDVMASGNGSGANGSGAAAQAGGAPAANGLALQQQQQQLKQQPQLPPPHMGLPPPMQGMPPGLMGMGPQPPIPLHQAMAMQAAAAAAAASGALPGSMPPPFMPLGMGMPPGMPGALPPGMPGGLPPGMPGFPQQGMPPGLDMSGMPPFGAPGGMMFGAQPPVSMAQAQLPVLPPASMGQAAPAVGLCAPAGPDSSAVALGAPGVAPPAQLGLGAVARPGSSSALLGGTTPELQEQKLVPPASTEAPLALGGFGVGGQEVDPLGQGGLGDMAFLSDLGGPQLQPKADPDDFLDLFLNSDKLTEEL